MREESAGGREERQVLFEGATGDEIAEIYSGMTGAANVNFLKVLAQEKKGTKGFCRVRKGRDISLMKGGWISSGKIELWGYLSHSWTGHSCPLIVSACGNVSAARICQFFAPHAHYEKTHESCRPEAPARRQKPMTKRQGREPAGSRPLRTHRRKKPPASNRKGFRHETRA